MPAASGPYQSRILNQAVRYLRQVSVTSRQVWRQAQVAALWGAQLVLYPAYAVFQTTRLAGRQLQQAAATVRRSLPGAATTPTQTNSPAGVDSGTSSGTNSDIHSALNTIATSDSAPAQIAAYLQTVTQVDPPAVDQPVQTVLSLLPSLDLDRNTAAAIAPVGITPGIETISLGGQIRGFASSLTDRQLMLVRADNEALDVLTAAQRQQLNTRIWWEVHNYAQGQDQLRFLQQSAIVPAALPASGLGGSAVVKTAYQLMAWVQRSPIAIGLNLFHESALRPLPMFSELQAFQPAATVPNANPILPDPSLTRWISPALDHTLARLEAADISPVVDGVTAWWQSRPWGRRSRPTQPDTSSPLDSPELNIPQPQTKSPPQGLAAFWRSPFTPTPPPAPLNSTPASPASPPLDWELVPPTGMAGAYPRVDGVPHPDLAMTGKFQRRSPQSAPRIAQTEPRRQPETATVNPAAQPFKPTADTDRNAISTTAETKTTAQPTWIEANVTWFGYDYHWFERVLIWLDHGLVWVETKLSQFVQRFRR